ncbi:MAG TPA: Uma2 family endonuclease [Nodosilinea sp.]|nr:Uma2 family endonuclease [Nodosilinea sp.]
MIEAANYLRGVRLGWLINPSSRQVKVYQPGRAAELLHNPAHLSGDPVLPGSVLTMGLAW